MKRTFKTHFILRLGFGILYFIFLFNASKLALKLFHGGGREIADATFTINFCFHLLFLVLFAYVYSRFIFVTYEINRDSLIVRHPLGVKRYFLKEISFVNEKVPFLNPFNILRVYIKNGKQVNVMLVNNHLDFLQVLRSRRFELSSQSRDE